MDEMLDLDKNLRTLGVKNTFPQGKVHLYALFRHGSIYEKILNIFLPQGRGGSYKSN